jgi:hypothetical protein
VATTDEQKVICIVLETLLGEGLDWIRRSAQPTSSKAAGSIAVARGRYGILTASELTSLLMHGAPIGNFDEKILFVTPPAKEDAAAAALWCRWDCEGETATFGFYFGLWSPQTAFPKSTGSATTIRHTAFVGYRFETPEAGENHNYYHAQPCRSMGRKDQEIEAALPISNRAPTWPLPADGALELLLCLVTALYGMEGLQRLRSTVLSDVSARKNNLLSGAFDAILGLRRPKAEVSESARA